MQESDKVSESLDAVETQAEQDRLDVTDPFVAGSDVDGDTASGPQDTEPQDIEVLEVQPWPIDEVRAIVTAVLALIASMPGAGWVMGNEKQVLELSQDIQGLLFRRFANLYHRRTWVVVLFMGVGRYVVRRLKERAPDVEEAGQDNFNNRTERERQDNGGDVDTFAVDVSA